MLLLSVGGRNMNKTCAMGYGYSLLFRFYLIIKVFVPVNSCLYLGTWLSLECMSILFCFFTCRNCCVLLDCSQDQYYLCETMVTLWQSESRRTSCLSWVTIIYFTSNMMFMLFFPFFLSVIWKWSGFFGLKLLVNDGNAFPIGFTLIVNSHILWLRCVGYEIQ